MSLISFIFKNDQAIPWETRSNNQLTIDYKKNDLKMKCKYFYLDKILTAQVTVSQPTKSYFHNCSSNV
jgi:hypothetical protein